ncbi:MAG: hypothetical protein J6S83_10275 [Lachnospiraceae bacterium]|nr:hypothetical protein [Lachnospiraceae bacterium]
MKIKKMMAAVLAAVMTMSAAGSALAAAQSPTEAAVDGFIDYNEQDHTGNLVVSEINQDEATAIKAEYTGGDGKTVWFKDARNSKNETVPITTVGNGKKGLFNSKKGRKITRAIFASSKDTVVKKLAFKGSNVKLVAVSGKKKVTFSKNSFKGTKQKKVTLQFRTKKASSVKLKKGAFNGLTKVTVKGLSKKEYNKFLKAAKKAGIKTSIFKKG